MAQSDAWKPDFSAPWTTCMPQVPISWSFESVSSAKTSLNSCSRRQFTAGPSMLSWMIFFRESSSGKHSFSAFNRFSAVALPRNADDIYFVWTSSLSSIYRTCLVHLSSLWDLVQAFIKLSHDKFTRVNNFIVHSFIVWGNTMVYNISSFVITHFKSLCDFRVGKSSFNTSPKSLQKLRGAWESTNLKAQIISALVTASHRLAGGRIGICEVRALLGLAKSNLK